MSSSPPIALGAALVLFSSVAFTLTPVTADAAEVRSFPDGVDPGSEDGADDAPEQVGAPTQEHEASGPATVTRQRRRSLMGDLSSRWFHVGGGAGLVADPFAGRGAVAGRFVLGGGAYTIGLYGGGGMEITGSPLTTPSLSAVGNLGVAIPVPVVHPMVGLRALAGLHASKAGIADGTSVLSPHIGAGMQAGFIIREFDGRPGVRVMLDGGFEYRLDDGSLWPEAFVTVAAVF